MFTQGAEEGVLEASVNSATQLVSFSFFLQETVIVPFISHLSSPRPVVVCVGRSEIELSLSVFPLLLIPDVRRPQYRLVIRRRG